MERLNALRRDRVAVPVPVPVTVHHTISHHTIP